MSVMYYKLQRTKLQDRKGHSIEATSSNNDKKMEDLI